MEDHHQKIVCAPIGLLIMFDIEIGEVYSVNQEVPNTGRHRKNIGPMQDL